MPLSPASYPTRSRAAFKALLMGLALLLGACAAPPPPGPPKPDFEQDVIAVTDGLLTQWHGSGGAGLFAKMSGKTVAMGSISDLVDLNQASGKFMQEESLASGRVKQLVAGHLAAQGGEFKMQPLRTDTADRSQGLDLLLSGHLMRASTATAKAGASTPLVLTLMLLDVKTRQVQARWQGPVRASPADLNPSAYFRDSPVLLTETGKDATRRRAALQSAAQGSTVAAEEVDEALSQALLAQAQDAYAAADYGRALLLFQAAAKSSAQALRAYNGQYLSYLKLGQTEQARQAFKQVVAEGLASRTLAVKFLFIPGQTSFWNDPTVSGAYDFWLQEISTQAANAPTCLEIAGHTSRSGEEAYNQKLSLARSEKVRSLMQAQQAGLAKRLSASGRGWLENIVGSGTDDARDAIDRRVEFKVLDCPRT